MINRSLRAAVVGGVGTSAVAARRIAESRIQLVGIAGHEPKRKSASTKARNLSHLAGELDVDYLGFTHVNDHEVIEQLSAWDLDFLFVIGLSQLVSPEVRETARVGCVGYHPTALPQGRGRAPVAWIILGEVPAASTLFELQDEADSGGILEQVPFQVTEDMDAADVIEECQRTLAQAMDRLLTKLQKVSWSPKPQEESLATYLGKRDPGDGLIDWETSAREVDALIRAAAPPHPGAYVYHEGRRLRILSSAGVLENSKSTGVVGKVLRQSGGSYEVQCGDGVVGISDIYTENGEPVKLREGALLATRVQDEIHALQQRVRELEAHVSRLSAETNSTFST